MGMNEIIDITNQDPWNLALKEHQAENSKEENKVEENKEEQKQIEREVR